MKMSMGNLKLSSPSISVLIELFKNGKITNSKSGLYRMAYYTIIWYLKDRKLITCKGVNENNEKIWGLTELGKSIAFHVNEIVKIYEGGLKNGKAVDI